MTRCVTLGGLSLHANVAVPAGDRQRLERLCRYVARPPLAIKRLSRLPDGRLLYGLRPRNYSWAELMHRVFGGDPGHPGVSRFACPVAASVIR
jgi:hypothetical protein